MHKRKLSESGVVNGFWQSSRLSGPERGTIIGCLWVVTILFVTVNPVVAQRMHVSLANGSSIDVEVSEQSFVFDEIRPNETVIKKTVRFQDVYALRVTLEPISKLRKNAEQLLHQLGTDNYHDREKAEVLLGTLEVGGRFRKLIRSRQNSPSREVRYRVKRILEKLASSDNSIPAQRDLLILKDGSKISGDASAIIIQGTAFGVDVRFGRDQILGLRQSSEARRSVVGPVNVQTFVSHKKRFYGENDTKIGFELDPFEKEIVLVEKLNKAFVPLGISIGNDSPRYSRASAFVFSVSPIKVGEHSLCVYNPEKSKRFEGALEFEFCLPGQIDVAAGVYRFGVFIGEIEHSRDFVVEAFDAYGNVLGMVESTDENCCFAGFESNVQIAKIRIQQNPYLNTNRKLDRFYVADNVTFDSPVGLVSPTRSAGRFVRLKSGEMVSADRFEVAGDSLNIRSPDFAGPVSVKMSEVESIKTALGKLDSNRDNVKWRVMTVGGSILNANVGDSFEIRDAEWRNWFEQTEIAGAWHAGSGLARYAPGSDFPTTKPVLVFPGCRLLADEFSIDAKKMSWGQESEAKLQKVIVAENEVPGELDDVVPGFHMVEHATSDQVPTIWFAAPQARRESDGAIHFRNGEKIVLGPTSGIKIESVHSERIVVSKNGEPRSISFDRVLSVSFPE